MITLLRDQLEQLISQVRRDAPNETWGMIGGKDGSNGKPQILHHGASSQARYVTEEDRLLLRWLDGARTQAFAGALPDGVEGNVVNILDQKVLRLTPDYFSYTIAKAALWSATQMMAQALAPKIRVNAIAPGPVLKHEGQSQSTFERECGATPLQRAVSAEDVAGAVRFLIETPSITGQVIALDSGQHLAFDAESGA
jgi:NAD(P)-dependent dehydrogenase (short-subunit alcohol dehydrogenase family)